MGAFNDTIDNWWHNLTHEQQLHIFDEYRKQFVAGDDYKKPEKPNVYTKHFDPNEKPLVPMWDNTTHSQVAAPTYEDVLKTLTPKEVMELRFNQWDVDDYRNAPDHK